MVVGDGNGWVSCRCGLRHWGRFGAAGLLLVRGAGRPEVLLQLRATWTHEGGSWGLLGGARDSHESVPEAALREASEEGAVDAVAVAVVDVRTGADHGDWRYDYVLARALDGVAPRVMTAESDELRWTPVGDVAGLPLHSGLRAAWQRLEGWIAERGDGPHPPGTGQPRSDSSRSSAAMRPT